MILLVPDGSGDTTSLLSHAFCQFDIDVPNPLSHCPFNIFVESVIVDLNTWANDIDVVGMEYLWGEPDALDVLWSWE